MLNANFCSFILKIKLSQNNRNMKISGQTDNEDSS